MAEKVLMLALSPTMDTGTIVNWQKKEGDEIASGDVLCEVETDKTTMDYETTQEGTLLKILVDAGGQVKVGDPIGVVGEQGEDISGILEEIQARDTEEKAEEKTEENAEPEAGTQRPEQESPAPRQPAPAAQKGGPAHQAPQGVLASPLARKIAQERGIDLRRLSGSGPAGRIVKRDVEQAPAGAAAPEQPVTALADETIPVSEKRRVIARRLSESFYSAPHYYEKIVVSAEHMLDARARINARAKEKLSLNAFIVKLVAEAIRKHPMVNASWQGESIIKHGSIDIGLAVAQPDGLITPVVRGCQAKGIAGIDRELKDLIEKAMNNRLAPEEYTGATFTISNLGSFGIRDFTAIINPPASAILAIGEVVKQPVVDDNDAIVVQRQMAMTISCDHRILDGAVSAAFMKTLKDIFEDPIAALL
jgi:pyruvate dehydrogenase E2 component (dihydrolipoamide acetyltransferase)